MKTEIIYGVHPVREAFAAGRRSIFELYVAREQGGRLETVIQTCEARKIPVKRIKPEQLSSVAKTSDHQGVGANVSIYPSVELNEILVRRPGQNPPFFLILDQIVDPHNFGALVRTALGVGMDAAIIPKDRSAPSSPAASKASAGALEHMRVARATNLVNAMARLKETGVWIAGLDRGAEKSIFDSDLAGPLALAVGAEEKGLRPLVKSTCDFLISIPQVGPLDSLNASAAGAAAMYEAFRQRNQGNRGRKQKL